MNKDAGDFRQRDNFIKQQQQLKAMKPTGSSKTLSADSMIEDLLSKKETFQKKTEASTSKNVPSWLSPDNLASVHPLYTKIWEMVKLPSSASNVKTHDLADTPLVSSLLMTSGLTTDMLGFIWSLANNTIPGALTQTELYSILALVALAQSGYIFNSIAVLNQLPQPPLPNLNLSVLVQMKGNFNPVMNIGYEAPAGNNVGQPVGPGYFNHYPTSETKTPSGNIVPLDVNSLQSAPSLTIPNSFSFQQSSIHSMQQDFGPLQTAQPVTAAQSGVIPVQPNVGTSNQGLAAAIPSISLGLSQPVTNVGSPITPQQNYSTVGTPVLPLNDIQSTQTLQASNITSGMNFSLDSSYKLNTAENFEMGFSSPNIIPGSNLNKIKNKLSELNLSDNKVTEPINVPDSFNVDESFDSLSTERALNNTNKPAMHSNISTIYNGENKTIKPNYDVNLFDSYNDIKPIFPVSDSGQRNDTFGDNDDSHVMHNPIFNNEDDTKSLNLENKVTPSISVDFALNANVLNQSNVQSVEDDFTDFQSADFTSFNNFHSIPDNKSDELSDNFSDFQQATAVSSFDNVIGSAGLTDDNIVRSGRKISGNGNDEELFSSLNLKFDNLNPSVKGVEISDSLSIKSIDISIISSGNNTDGNSSPISNDFSQEQMKDDSNGCSQTNDGYKDDKVFLSLSSSLVFDNTNPRDDYAAHEGSSTSLNNSNQNYSYDQSTIKTQEQVGDKYSALRMLENSSVPDQSKETTDDFGDFVAAEPEQLQLPDVIGVPSDSSADFRSSEVKCLEACLNILEKSYEILKSASTPDVLSQILADQRGSEHLSCLLEVYKVSERLMQHPDCKSTALASQVQTTWDLLLEMVPDAISNYQKQLQMEENAGPKCGVCKCSYGPKSVRYGLNYYHPPCANLYLRYVSSLLPSVPI